MDNENARQSHNAIHCLGCSAKKARVVYAIDETRSISKYHEIRLPNGDLVVPFRTLCGIVATCCVIVNVRSASCRGKERKKKKKGVRVQ